MAQGQLRQRKGKGDEKKESEAGKEQTSSTDAVKRTRSSSSQGAACAPVDETLWQTFASHPLIRVAPFVLIPYALYVCFCFVSLKRPDLASTLTQGQVQLRPAVRLNDTRQVLILGAIGSGIQHVATELQDVMKLEVMHETSNAEAYFTRDGTVSSFLAVRYVPREDAERITRTFAGVCIDRPKGTANALKPKLYQPSFCPSYKSWSPCHARECLQLVTSEWGCGLTDSCRSKFASVLHQVRHPVRTIQELVANVCPGDAVTVHPAFRQLATIFFDDSEATSCLAPLAWYVIDFNRALLAATKNGAIHGFFRYEDVSLFEIARLAGFLHRELAIHPRTAKRLLEMCGSAIANTPTTSRLSDRAPASDSTRSLPVLTWEDFRGAGGSQLIESLRSLCSDLGYDPDNTDQGGF